MYIEGKGTRIAKTIFRKVKVGGISLYDFKMLSYTISNRDDIGRGVDR